MLQLKCVSKKGIIEQLSLKVESGQKMVLIGKNGTGKTTAIRMLAGICLPDSGKIQYDSTCFDFPLSFLQYKKYWEYIRRHIFYSEGNSILYNNFTVIQNINYYTNLGKYDMDEFNHVCKELDFTEPLNKPVAKLSLGNKQKVAAILALLSTKKIIILDEPTLGMDNATTHSFMQYLTSQNKTVVVSTHEHEYYDIFEARFSFDEPHN